MSFIVEHFGSPMINEGVQKITGTFDLGGIVNSYNGAPLGMIGALTNFNKGRIIEGDMFSGDMLFAKGGETKDSSNEKDQYKQGFSNKYAMKMQKYMMFNDGGEITGDEPSIYVADLAAYNDGKLEGFWLRLTDYDSGYEVAQKIADFLNEQTKKSGELREEYAIHDFENFPRELYSEYMTEEDFDKIIQAYKAQERLEIPFDIVLKVQNEYGLNDFEQVQERFFAKTDGWNEEKDLGYEYVEIVGMESVQNKEYYFDFDEYGSDIRQDYSEEELEENNYDELSDSELGELFVEMSGGINNLSEETIENYFDYESFGDDLTQDFVGYKGEGNDYYWFYRNYKKGGTFGLGGFVAGTLVGAGATYFLTNSKKDKTQAKVQTPNKVVRQVKKLTAKEEAIVDFYYRIMKGDLSYAINEGYLDTSKIKDPKLTALANSFQTNTKALKNYIDRNDPSHGIYSTASALDKEGLDYGFLSGEYNDWKKIKDIKFQSLLKKAKTSYSNILAYLKAKYNLKDLSESSIENAISEIEDGKFADGGEFGNGGFTTKKGFDVYHNTLASTLDEVQDYARRNEYTLGDFSREVGHITYGTTWRAYADCFDENGKEVNTLQVQIYRMDSGRYELNMYFDKKRKKRNDTEYRYDEEPLPFGDGGKVTNKQITLIFNGKQHKYPATFIDGELEDVEIPTGMSNNPLWDYVEKDWDAWFEVNSENNREIEYMYYGEEAIYSKSGAIRQSIEEIIEQVVEEVRLNPNKTTFNLDKGDVEVGANYYAKGGLTEHGLKKGDVIGNSEDNKVIVYPNNKDEEYTVQVVNLNKGIRMNAQDYLKLSEKEQRTFNKLANGGEITDAERKNSRQNNLKLFR